MKTKHDFFKKELPRRLLNGLDTLTNSLEKNDK
jgi:hypothetical protein